MKQVKRINVDLRGSDTPFKAGENMVNEELLNLQKNGANILSIDEVNKDSGKVVVIVLYEKDIPTDDEVIEEKPKEVKKEKKQ